MAIPGARTIVVGDGRYHWRVNGSEPWLDPYAAEDPAEFFAVCSEMFFDVPGRFRAEYPDVYAQLTRYFKLDLA